MNTDINIRLAEEKDILLILDFVKGLAEYEKFSADVIATKELLHKWLFEEKTAEVLIAEVAEKAAGFALFFRTFSTFMGLPCLYLEDLFVYPEARGRGIGAVLFKTLAKIAVERGYGRFEWECLDWNEPSIGFYKSMGAEQLTDRRKFRLTGKELEKLGK